MEQSPSSKASREQHWDAAYRGCGVERVSWFQSTPTQSLRLIDQLGISRDAAVVDIGGGASSLVDHLLELGFADIAVLDVSPAALDSAKRRVGVTAPVSWLHEDLLGWQPPRRFDVWHDRALLHFLVEPRDRERYLATLRSALNPGAAVIIATFAADGPDHCSGLPVRRYSDDDLAAWLGDDFHVIETCREEHTTPGGGNQPFTWIAARARV